jgi:MoaA/NifB/PqqE/SkfB family radical SAM enzyme
MNISGYVSLVSKILYSQFFRLPLPYKLTYSVTNKCNYRCIYCNTWKEKSINELTFDEIKKVFDNARHFLWVDLTGGEPFLRTDFVDINEVVIKNCKGLILLHYQTNGYLTDLIVSDTQRILSFKPERLIVTVSLDGYEKLNNRIRGTKDGWEHQIETFRQLRKLKGVSVVLGFTLYPDNVDCLPETYRAIQKVCPDFSYKDLHVNIAHLSEHLYFNKHLEKDLLPADKIIYTLEGLKKNQNFSLHPVAILENVYRKKVPQYLYSGKSPLPCLALSASCFINPQGYVYPCSMYNKVVANLRDYNYNLKAIWDKEEAKKLQTEVHQLKCPQCWTPCEAYQTILGNLTKLP